VERTVSFSSSEPIGIVFERATSVRVRAVVLSPRVPAEAAVVSGRPPATALAQTP
jgi:hypothetical protein